MVILQGWERADTCVIPHQGLPPKAQGQAATDGLFISDPHSLQASQRHGGQGCSGQPWDNISIPFPLQIKIIKRLSLRQAAEQDQVQVYQYKIQDRNVTFFARGLSAAVL